MNDGPTSIWETHARQWQWIGSPLRPARADQLAFEQAVRDGFGPVPRPLHALLLGVTPEIAALAWPAGSELLALDRSLAMIRSVWPGHPADGRHAACSDWNRLPLASSTRDVVMGDGSLAMLAHPLPARAVCAEIARVLVPDGLLILRAYCLPARQDPPEQVIEDLFAGRIRNFDSVRLRLAMALQPDPAHGIVLADLWSYWHARITDAAALARRCGWPPERIRTIDAYRALQTRYHFPTHEDMHALLATCFTVERVHVHDYELGERCPVFVARRRP
ncbi:MAG: methyltransferase domain-containing protein [Gammaproteobacteria bacterium]|nr:methyltransferase domain-containing protein [Gammaproteobacteria bacterium]